MSELSVEEFYIGQNCFARVERGIVRIRKQYGSEIYFDLGGVSILYHHIEAIRKQANEK